MSMLNKCAKFHGGSASDKNVNFNLPSAIELSETAVFVYNFVLYPFPIRREHNPKACEREDNQKKRREKNKNKMWAWACVHMHSARAA